MLDLVRVEFVRDSRPVYVSDLFRQDFGSACDFWMQEFDYLAKLFVLGNFGWGNAVCVDLVHLTWDYRSVSWVIKNPLSHLILGPPRRTTRQRRRRLLAFPLIVQRRHR